MTWRELGVFIGGLPMESAFRTAARDRYSDDELADMAEQSADSKHGPWSRHELLTASLIYEMRRLNHMQLARGGVKNAPLPEPVRVPGLRTTKRVNPAKHAYLQAIRDRHEAETAVS